MTEIEKYRFKKQELLLKNLRLQIEQCDKRADEQVKKVLDEEINKLDNKLQNTEYDSVFNRDCDADDLRCLKRTLEILQESYELNNHK